MAPNEFSSSNRPLAIPLLIVLVGPPGSGKTTWAKRNGAGAVHVSQDDLIDAITPNGFEHIYRPIYASAEDAIARAALSAGHTVIVDRTNRTRAHRERWLSIAREALCQAVAVTMSTSKQICTARNAARRDRRFVSTERMERMFSAMESPREGEGFAAVFDETATLEKILEQQKENVSNEHCHQTR